MTSGSLSVSQTLLLLALLLLIVGTAVAALALGGRTWLRLPGVALASAGSAAWLLLDKTLEGPLLVNAPGPHGLVLADLLVLPAVAVCACLAVDDVRERRAVADGVSRTGQAGPG